MGGLRFRLLVGRLTPDDPDAVQRKEGALEVLRLLDDHLAGRPWLVGGRYTIADVAVYGYTHLAHEAGIDMQPYANLRAWFERVERQPGLRRGRRAVRRERGTGSGALALRLNEPGPGARHRDWPFRLSRGQAPGRGSTGRAVGQPGAGTWTRPKRTVGSGRAPDRRPLRGLLHRPAVGVPARVDAARDAQVGRLGARPRGRRRVQAAQLDDAADRGRGRGRSARAARRPQAGRQERGPARDPDRRDPQRRRARDGRGRRAREGRRRARPPARARGAARGARATASGSCAASGRPRSGRST